MLLKNILNAYNLLLSLGAFYLAVLMFLERGVFHTFPQEWIGVMPFNNWSSLALFGVIVFGIGNGIASTYGFIKKDNKIFTITFTMGALFFLCTVIPTIILGEWYLPTSAFFVLSLIQILLGLFGFLNFCLVWLLKNRNKKNSI
ncbi:hypothetical protein CD30_13340 [Ureibacillus massiliensis 4400831 = CIP 108448 = CCUG 49529]|uniref:Uncharacterized protein n=1 Tax=Ureibacillus massiliensis 4400831 = CIP 108448 = CCUG 49529 TaxID=1211035 RepID=A0A0A3J340_9BACL|nr:hypothetical protein [Ureibacillus massiliensis]KGR90130.1 hypothetical protein CD30_13340 [Ureibacillus massiliensis 4400831 = CIP 108448 = CCUG 49529]RKJ14970.1 hypothetical protein D7X33_48095 [Butyricicoccus sp. 1XD8-22]